MPLTRPGKEGVHRLPRRLPAETLLRTVVQELVDPPEPAAPIDANEDFFGYRRRISPFVFSFVPAPGEWYGWRRTRRPQLQGTGYLGVAGELLAVVERDPCADHADLLEQPDDLGGDHVRLLGRHPPHQCEPGHLLHQCHEIARPGRADHEVALQCPTLMRSSKPTAGRVSIPRRPGITPRPRPS